MALTRQTRQEDKRHIETCGERHHREFLKQDLIRMARGDQYTPLISTRRRASSSLTDLLSIVDASSMGQTPTLGQAD
jgi:hypothetical protein